MPIVVLIDMRCSDAVRAWMVCVDPCIWVIGSLQEAPPAALEGIASYIGGAKTANWTKHKMCSPARIRCCSDQAATSGAASASRACYSLPLPALPNELPYVSVTCTAPSGV